MLVDYEDRRKAKMRSDDRILKLEVIDGKSALSTTGLVDSRLFTGNNTLHAIMNPMNCLWSFKYADGIVPAPLKNQFTSFEHLKRYADTYFNKRNIRITEVKNA